MSVFSEDLFDVFEKKDEPITPSVKKKKKRVREVEEESSRREEESKRARPSFSTDSSGEGPSTRDGGEPSSASKIIASSTTDVKPQEASKDSDG